MSGLLDVIGAVGTAASGSAVAAAIYAGAVALNKDATPDATRHFPLHSEFLGDYDGTDVSYLARISEALPLTAAGMMFGPNDPPADRSLLQLAETGHVVFIPPLPLKAVAPTPIDHDAESDLTPPR